MGIRYYRTFILQTQMPPSPKKTKQNKTKQNKTKQKQTNKQTTKQKNTKIHLQTNLNVVKLTFSLPDGPLNKWTPRDGVEIEK